MIRRLMLAALLSSGPAVATAQSSLCDGAELRRLADRRRLGGAIAGTALATNFLVFLTSRGSSNPADAPAAIERGRHAMTFAFLSLPVILLGGYLHESSYPDESFWARAIARMRVGETTTTDVRVCLRTPSAMTSAGAEEQWTYFITRPGGWRSRRASRSVTLTFVDGVLREIRRSEVDLRDWRPWPGIDPR